MSLLVASKWTRACDKSLARMISYIHHTSEIEQYCHVRNVAQQCRLGLFQDSDFAGDLENSKSISEGLLCMFGSHTFVPRGLLDVPETGISFTQFYRSQDYFSGCRSTDGRYPSLGSLEFGNRGVSLQPKPT